MLKNPFIPGDPIIDSSNFFGREAELDIILDSISNRRNVMITGDRGIGKTSLANQIVEFLSDKNSGNKYDGVSGVIASYSCTKDSFLVDICEGLLNSLKRRLVESQEASYKGIPIIP